MAWSVGSSTDVLVRQLYPFADLLKSTQHSESFRQWSEATVESAFHWADKVKEGMGKSDKLQFQAVGDQLGPLHIGVLDADMEDVLRRPAVAILRAVMASPFLLAMPAHVSVILACMQECERRVGLDEVTIAAAGMFRRALDARRWRNLLSERLLGENGDALTAVSGPECMVSDKWMFGHTETCLAVNLMRALYRHIVGAESDGGEGEVYQASHCSSTCNISNGRDVGHERRSDNKSPPPLKKTKTLDIPSRGDEVITSSSVSSSSCSSSSSQHTTRSPFPRDILDRVTEVAMSDDRTLAVVVAALTMPHSVLVESLSSVSSPTVHGGCVRGVGGVDVLDEANRLIKTVQQHEDLERVLVACVEHSPWRLVVPYQARYLGLLVARSPVPRLIISALRIEILADVTMALQLAAESAMTPKYSSTSTSTSKGQRLGHPSSPPRPSSDPSHVHDSIAITPVEAVCAFLRATDTDTYTDTGFHNIDSMQERSHIVAAAPAAGALATTAMAPPDVRRGVQVVLNQIQE